MTEPLSTAKRLALELEQLGAPPRLVARVEVGYFSDFRSASKAPKVDLYNTLMELGYTELAQRVSSGEFDDTREDLIDWFRSVDGFQTLREIFPAISQQKWIDLFEGN